METSEKIFSRNKYTSPKTSNIRYCWVLTAHHRGLRLSQNYKNTAFSGPIVALCLVQLLYPV